MSNKKVISKLLAIGTAVTVTIATSITAFASGVIYLRYSGMAAVSYTHLTLPTK